MGPSVPRVYIAFRVPVPGCNKQKHGPSSFSYCSGPGTELSASQIVQAMGRGVRPPAGAPSPQQFRYQKPRTRKVYAPRQAVCNPQGRVEPSRQACSACALADWLTEPATEPMGARLIVRRAASRREGLGRPAVAVETPGELKDCRFGDVPRVGARLC